MTTRAVRGRGVQSNASRGQSWPPDELDVQIAIARLRAQDPPPLLGVPERREVIAILTAEGWSMNRIAAGLGMAQRSISRHIAAVRQTDPDRIPYKQRWRLNGQHGRVNGWAEGAGGQQAPCTAA